MEQTRHGDNEAKNEQLMSSDDAMPKAGQFKKTTSKLANSQPADERWNTTERQKDTNRPTTGTHGERES